VLAYQREVYTSEEQDLQSAMVVLAFIQCLTIVFGPINFLQLYHEPAPSIMEPAYLKFTKKQLKQKASQNKNNRRRIKLGIRNVDFS